MLPHKITVHATEVMFLRCETRNVRGKTLGDAILYGRYWPSEVPVHLIQQNYYWNVCNVRPGQTLCHSCYYKPVRKRYR